MASIDPAKFDWVCLTFDVDWANDEILQYVAASVTAAGLTATFFATHDSPLLKDLTNDQFEIGLHPNFNRQDDIRSPLTELLELYPEARGTRSHLLAQSPSILDTICNLGLVYESNIHLPFHSGLRPVVRVTDLVSIPFCWADDTHFRVYPDRPISDIPFQLPGLKVLAFHPIHVFMNTSSVEHYESYKQHYHDTEALRQHKNTAGRGVETMFTEVLTCIREQQIRTTTLADVHNLYTNLTGPDAD